MPRDSEFMNISYIIFVQQISTAYGHMILFDKHALSHHAEVTSLNPE